MRAHVTRRVATLGIVAAFLLIGVPASHGAEASVDWINRINVTVSGDTLHKTGGCNGCDDAGAVSRQVIWRGDGYVEFRPGEANTFWLAGLSHGDHGTTFEDIDFAFRFNGAGRADVMENGVYQNGGDTTYAAGDMFRVAVVGGRVHYFKNGQLLLVSGKAPEYPLLLDTALGSAGTTVRAARIGHVEDAEFFDDEGGPISRRFDALDADNDGQIAWYEWPGSFDSFDAQDLNRDGVLTWGELSEVGGDGSARIRTIDLDPRQRWTDTGLWVSRGDLLTVDASGVVQLSTSINDVAGPAGARSGRRAANAPLSDQRAGAVIAWIGTAVPILIGDQRTVIAPETGRLYLGVNDDHLADNTGQFRVHVVVQPRY